MPTFEIRRTFRASCREVFDCWTKAEHLQCWWVPEGFRMHIFKLEAKPGSLFHYNMKTEDNIYQMWGRFVFSDVEEPERIIFVNSFSDPLGNVARAPFSDTWPLELRNELIFSEVDGNTQLILKVTPVNAPQTDKITFEENFESLKNGFTGTFERLEEYLAQTDREIVLH